MVDYILWRELLEVLGVILLLAGLAAYNPSWRRRKNK